MRIDGIDVRDLGLASLRDKISVVAQETFLFNDTVANNIATGMPKANDDEARGRHRKPRWRMKFIEKLAQGYETVIGDRGVKLSADSGSGWPSRGRYSRIPRS